MKEWYTASDLAGLPGLPGTVRRVTSRAVSQAWPSRPRAGRGGGREYPLSALPPETQRGLMLAVEPSAGAALPPPRAKEGPHRRHLPGPPQAEAWAAFERLTERAKDEARRRLEILKMVGGLVASGRPRGDAFGAAADQTGEHPNTLRRWAKVVRGLPPADWLPALAPRHAGRTATAECSPEAWDFFKADFLRLEAPALSACYDRLRRAAQAHGWEVPSRGTLERRVKTEISREAAILAREGAEALKQAYPAQQRDRSVFHALEAVNADGHKFDDFVKWPNGEIVRPVGVFWQDLLSGKILSWRICKTENVDSVRLSFGDLVSEYGIPAAAYLDNGRGFAAKWITGGTANRYRFKVLAEEPVGVLTALGVQVHWTTPYHGQAKPIERAFRDLCEYVAKHPAFTGAYTGNNPTAKPENYGSKAIPLEKFLAVLSGEITAHNAREGRRSRVCAGRSFDQVFADSYAASAITKATGPQRRMFLLAAKSARCDRRDATVNLLGNRYYTPELSRYAGQRLVVRFDPDNLRAGVHCYQPNGAYIAEAPCLEAVGFNDTSAAREHARLRRQQGKSAREELARTRRMAALEAAALLPEPEAPPPPNSKIVRPLFGSAKKHGHAGSAAPLPEDRPDYVNDTLQRVVGAWHEQQD